MTSSIHGALAAAMASVDQDRVKKVLKQTFPTLTPDQYTDLEELILGPLTMVLSWRESAQQMPTAAETRTKIASLKLAIEAVQVARANLGIEASSRLRVAANLGIVRSDGYRPEPGTQWWSAFDQALQTAVALADQTLNLMPKPDSRRQAPFGLDDLVGRLVAIFRSTRPHEEGEKSSLHSTKAGGFVPFAVDLIACVQDYPETSADDIRNALHRLERMS